MADKYTGLPGIDIESAEVFETSDIDSDVDIDAYTDVDASEKNADIEEPEIDSSEARSRFSNDVLVGDINMVDFLGSITNSSLTRTGYQVNQVDETVDQRLSRIARELEEIKILQLNDSSNTKTSDCNKLVQTLESLAKEPLLSPVNDLNQYNHRIKQVFDEASARLETTGTDGLKTLQKPPLVDTSQVLALESRLNAIESVLGPDGTTNIQSQAESKPTIQNWLNELTRKLNVVHNPEYQLDTVKKEVALLTKQIETLASHKRFLDLSHLAPTNPPPQPDSSHKQINSKIEDLHEKLPFFNHVNATVPLIVTRLKSLHTVHADLANTVQTVHELDLILNDIKSDMKKWNDSIDVVNANIDDHDKQYQSNKEHINLLLKDLNDKVSSMSQ
ncbi:unnamed protein product [Debaryomyces tyrocola]|nr:unnamed protein product [Debaryomyces tyrocola]